MEAIDVIPIPPRQEPDPWPRILLAIAGLATAFAIAQGALDSRTIYWDFFGRYQHSSPTLDRRWRMSMALGGALAVADLLNCCLMIFGAAWLLLRFGSTFAIVLAARIWLALWLLGVLYQFNWMGSFVLRMLPSNATFVAFPVTMMLLLREYKARN